MMTPRIRLRKKQKFLEEFAKIGNVSRACELSGVARRTILLWREGDAVFAQAYREAEDQAVDRLELEAQRRAHDGVAEPVFHKGEVCGTIQRYSDTLLMFLLNGMRPQKYRRNGIGLDGRDGHVTIVIQNFTDGAPKEIIEVNPRLEGPA